MSIVEQKIITFLTRNAHLDCEIPDVAFHLKLDEKKVQTALDGLLEKGVVTTRQNQFGHTYWYYVPQRSSIPFETLSSQLPEELAEYERQVSAIKNLKKTTLIVLILSTISIISIPIVFAWTNILINSTLKNYKILESIVKQDDLIKTMDSTEKRIIKIENELKKSMTNVDSLKNIIKSIKNDVNYIKDINY